VGIYSEYLDKQLDFQALTQERKKQLRRISELREHRDVLVMAADLKKSHQAISIHHTDLLAVNDQLSNMNGKALDLILETPGGSGEVAEDIVRLIRGRYESVGIIVPGIAKSAGTIMAMAGDEILLEPVSALGPIDAQIQWQGKVFSAHALLEGMEKIKKEVTDSGTLNRAYIPILQNISPGELQHAQNALDFARELVRDWLARYKFKEWKTHSSTGAPVTEEERTTRAREIADVLCDHGRWKTHGRSIKLEDFNAMRLRVTDYSTSPDLCDAIRRYHTLLQMTFDTNIYKIFETPDSQIIRFEIMAGVAVPQSQAADADVALVDLQCNKCKTDLKIQATFKPNIPVPPDRTPFPADNRLKCPTCGTEHDLTPMRHQIEAQTKRRIVARS
jgi:serine dehydrogenase proteinase